MMKGINYICRSSQMGESGEYDSDLQVFLNDTCIAFCSEGEELHIQGDFRDYVEKDTSTDGVPDVEHKSFYLDIIDLVNLQRISMWWLHEYNEPSDLERTKANLRGRFR